MKGIFSMATVSPCKQRLIFNLEDETNNQVHNYLRQIVDQSDYLFSTTIRNIEVNASNKLVLTKEKLAQLKRDSMNTKRY